MSDTNVDPHGLLGLLKHAAERFELKMLARDAEVRPSVVALLDPQVGSWAGTMSTWLMPGDPTDVQHVTSIAHWALGGKFLQRTFTGLFMDKPFEALCITGYDDAAERYVGVWMDSATTAMLPLQGRLDGGTQTLILEGSMKLVSHLPDVDIRTTIAMPEADSVRFEIAIGRLGIYVTAHEIELTRVSSS